MRSFCQKAFVLILPSLFLYLSCGKIKAICLSDFIILIYNLRLQQEGKTYRYRFKCCHSCPLHFILFSFCARNEIHWISSSHRPVSVENESLSPLSLANTTFFSAVTTAHKLYICVITRLVCTHSIRYIIYIP